MKTVKRIVFGCLFIGMASCDKMIETDMPNNQIGTEQVFEDAQTAYSALSGLYNNLRSNSLVSGNSAGMGALLGSYADDLDCYYTALNGHNDISTNQQLPTNTVIETVWKNAYLQIYAANAIIMGAQNSTLLSDTDRQQIMGEAIVIRSMIYLDLQRIFDNIPYTATIDYEHNRQLSKLGGAQIIALLETDLLSAVSMLGDTYRDPQRIYPNRQVAELLLVHVFMLQNKYAEAEQAALSIINSPLYQFETDINEVFHNSGAHIMWQIPPQYSGDATQEASFYYFEDGPPSAYALTDGLVSTFAPNDLRRTLWISEVTAGGQLWYRPNKYKNLSGNNTNEYSIVFRLEEVYLLLAEAMAMQDKLSEALPYLNATRIRAGLAEVVPTTRETLVQEILAEKRREFFAEQGIRFTDLKRTGNLSALENVKPYWSAYKSTWPLPQSELLLNTNLAPQNEGY